MNEILVGTDGSDNAEHAVAQAIELACAKHAKLLVAYVRHAPLPLLGEPVYQRSLSRELRHADEVTEAAAAKAREAGVEAEIEIVEGSPAPRILELALHVSLRGGADVVLGRPLQARDDRRGDRHALCAEAGSPAPTRVRTARDRRLQCNARPRIFLF